MEQTVRMAQTVQMAQVQADSNIKSRQKFILSGN